MVGYAAGGQLALFRVIGPRPVRSLELGLFDAHDKSRLHAARVSPEP